MYSFSYLEPVCCSMSTSNYCFLTCTYRFLKRQVRWSGIPICFRIFHSWLWSTQIGRASCRERVETVSDVIFLGSKITADGDCSHEIKRRLLLRGKVMTNLDSILKSRDITLPTKVHLVRLWFFQWSCMDVRVGLWRKLSAEELMLLNCGVGEDSWESLGLQGDPTNPF